MLLIAAIRAIIHVVASGISANISEIFYLAEQQMPVKAPDTYDRMHFPSEIH